MTLKKKISLGLLTLVCGVMLLFSFEIFMAANSGNLMPQMEESIGKTTDDIRSYSPELLGIIFVPIKVLSALIASFTIAILILAYGPFRKNLKYSTRAIFAPLILWLILATVIYSSQIAAPWQVWMVLLLLSLAALILNLTDKNSAAADV